MRVTPSKNNVGLRSRVKITTGSSVLESNRLNSGRIENDCEKYWTFILYTVSITGGRKKKTTTSSGHGKHSIRSVRLVTRPPSWSSAVESSSHLPEPPTLRRIAYGINVEAARIFFFSYLFIFPSFFRSVRIICRSPNNQQSQEETVPSTPPGFLKSPCVYLYTV